MKYFKGTKAWRQLPSQHFGFVPWLCRKLYGFCVASFELGLQIREGNPNISPIQLSWQSAGMLIRQWFNVLLYTCILLGSTLNQATFFFLHMPNMISRKKTYQNHFKTKRGCVFLMFSIVLSDKFNSQMTIFCKLFQTKHSVAQVNIWRIVLALPT